MNCKIANGNFLDRFINSNLPKYEKINLHDDEKKTEEPLWVVSDATSQVSKTRETEQKANSSSTYQNFKVFNLNGKLNKISNGYMHFKISKEEEKNLKSMNNKPSNFSSPKNLIHPSKLVNNQKKEKSKSLVINKNSLPQEIKKREKNGASISYTSNPLKKSIRESSLSKEKEAYVGNIVNLASIVNVANLSSSKVNFKKLNTERVMSQTNVSRNDTFNLNRTCGFKSPQIKRNLKTAFGAGVNNFQPNNFNNKLNSVNNSINPSQKAKKSNNLIKQAKEYFSTTVFSEKKERQVKKDFNNTGNNFNKTNVKKIEEIKGSKKTFSETSRGDSQMKRASKELRIQCRPNSEGQSGKLQQTKEPIVNIVSSPQNSQTVNNLLTRTIKPTHFSSDLSLFNMINYKREEVKEDSFFIKNKYRPLLENYLFA